MIFVDTSFWVAYRNRRDERHQEAGKLFERYVTGPLLTTNHVRGETWTLLRRRAGHHAAISFLDHIDRSPRLRVEFVSQDLEEDAWRWLRRHDEQPYSFVDGTSFAVMRSLRVTDALTFDRDFTAAGFHVLAEEGP